MATYDDYELCTPANKGGKGRYQDLLSLLGGVGNGENFNVLKQKQNEPDIIVFPNPTYDNCQLFSSEELNGNLFIFDITGRMIKELKIQSKINTIDLTKYSEGVYTYKLITTSGTYFGKIQKK